MCGQKKIDKYYIGFDIGGTTFSSSLFYSSIALIRSSEKSSIAKFQTTQDLLVGIAHQINQLLTDSKIDKADVIGMGASCPGPLDAKKGLILDTPNLILFRQFPVAAKLAGICELPVVIENDANLFAMGEWVVLQNQDPSVLIGITLGSGTGFGIVINGELFTGAHGMGAEYGISPVSWGRWEEGISIRSLKKMSLEQIGVAHTPAELYELAESGDLTSLNIWAVYGDRVGVFLSHAVNMLDPALITIGGGISNAFKYFEKSMSASLKRFAPAFSYYGTQIQESSNKELSSMIGAAMLAKKRIGNSG